ncbi:MAG: response regulator [Chthoniobacterales bacterium]|nr:response regulator [Chthoniobacterales bacterium]
MKTENHDHLRQELRLAQLEIKVLRDQLLKSTQETLQTHATSESPDTSTPAAKSGIIPMQPHLSVPAPRENNPQRVLYIEDSEPNFRLVECILEDRPGTELTWAATGRQGLDMTRANPPQLVLLDLDLPDLHGSKVLEELQAQPATAEIPVIVISADATPSQIERMLTAGARNYLTKPFEIRRLLCMFDEVFLPA